MPCSTPQVSHLLNKPIESICGYLTVLPGAFSAFRWAAVEVGGSSQGWEAACPPPNASRLPPNQQPASQG